MTTIFEDLKPGGTIHKKICTEWASTKCVTIECTNFIEASEEVCEHQPTIWTYWQEFAPQNIIDFICPKDFVRETETDNIVEAMVEAVRVSHANRPQLTPREQAAEDAGKLIYEMRNASYWHPNKYACTDLMGGKTLPFFTKESQVAEFQGLLEAITERTEGQVTCEAVMYMLHSYDALNPWGPAETLAYKGSSIIQDEVECLRTTEPNLVGSIENLYWKLIADMNIER